MYMDDNDTAEGKSFGTQARRGSASEGSIPDWVRITLPSEPLTRVLSGHLPRRFLRAREDDGPPDNDRLPDDDKEPPPVARLSAPDVAFQFRPCLADIARQLPPDTVTRAITRTPLLRSPIVRPRLSPISVARGHFWAPSSSLVREKMSYSRPLQATFRLCTQTTDRKVGSKNAQTESSE
jgi:hypothetical protein